MKTSATYCIYAQIVSCTNTRWVTANYRTIRRKMWQLKDYRQNTVLFSDEVALVQEGAMKMLQTGHTK